jgi:branched-chain amino acid transport system substrate-binding protein
MLRLILCVSIVWSILGGSLALAAEPIRIGVSLGLTGIYQRPATMQMRGYRLWEKHINASGGLLGRPVKVIIVDDNSDAGRARDIYTDLITKQGVDLLFGPYSSQIAAEVAPILDAHGYPTLLPGAAATAIYDLENDNVFGLFIPASKYGNEMISVAILHDLKRIAIIYADDLFSVDVAGGAKKSSLRMDRDVVLFERFEKGTHNLADLAAKAKDARAELIIVAGHFDESIDMRRALKNLDWYPRAYFATIGPTLQRYSDVLGPDANLTFSTSLWEPDKKLKFQGSQKFIESFNETFATQASYHAANAYAAGQILAQAVETAGSLDRNKIRQVLYDLDVHSIIGRYRVDETGLPLKHRPQLIQWQEGAKVIVYPEEIRGDARPVIK